jgi:hypothetical protein
MRRLIIGVAFALLVFLALAGVVSAQGPYYGWAGYYPGYYAPAYPDNYYHGFRDGYYWGYRDGYYWGYYDGTYGGYYPPYNTISLPAYATIMTPYVTHCQVYGANYPGGVCK